jgi:hypothetical protein
MHEDDVKLERKFKTMILVDDDVISEYAFKWALVYRSVCVGVVCMYVHLHTYTRSLSLSYI